MRCLFFIFINNISKRSILSVSFFLLAFSSFSQNQLYYPQQLREDADFFFKTIEQVHPNPYAFMSIEYIERFKKSILDRLAIMYGMDKRDFFALMKTTNHCFDGHTQLIDNILDSVAYDYLNNGGKVFPSIHLIQDSIFMELGGEKVKLISINGIKVIDILSEIKLRTTQEQKNKVQQECESAFSAFLLVYLHQKSPFNVEGVSASGKKINWIEKGVSISEKLLVNTYVKYRHFIFENDKIALIELNSFDNLDYKKFRIDMTTFFDSLRICGVKNLFVDLSHNSGGMLEPGLIFLDFIKHDTIFYSYKTARKVSRQSRNLGFRCPEEDIGRIVWETYDKTILLLPQPAGYDGKIYILQGLETYSAADQFTRILAQNRIGTRIGRETGMPVEHYSYTINQRLPNTGLEFSTSVYYYNIPVPTEKDGLVYPDILYSLDSINLNDIYQLKKILFNFNKQ